MGSRRSAERKTLDVDAGLSDMVGFVEAWILTWLSEVEDIRG